MGDKTGIEWADATWNPVTGCTKVSQGCKHCYAERVFPRVYRDQRVVVPTPADGCPGGDWMRPVDVTGHWTRPRRFTDVWCHHDRLDIPLRWARPRRIFVNSMSDLFHEDVSFEFIDQVFAVMALTPQHTFQVLTKRPERMLDWYQSNQYERVLRQADVIRSELPGRRVPQRVGVSDPKILPYRNVWLGVSVEDQATADERIPILLQTPAAVRWVSAEPLLAPIELEAHHGDPVAILSGRHWLGPPSQARGMNRGLDWVVVGGESGPRARPVHPGWVRSIRDQCQAAGAAFLFKQWGEWAPTKAKPISGQYTGGGVFLMPDGHLGAQGDWWGGRAAAMDKVGKKSAGRELDGVIWDQYPDVRGD